MKKNQPFKIISGGQTGVDRAALDIAIKLNINYGGWCPKGRLAEDGTIPSRYELTETPTSHYAQRTEWNVRDSNGTLIITQDGNLSGGTRLTAQKVIAYNKPYFILNMNKVDAIQHAAIWIKKNKIRILNIAGPRASQSWGIYTKTILLLDRLLKRLNSK